MHHKLHISNGRQGIARAAFLVGRVLCAVTLVHTINSSAAAEATPPAKQQRRSTLEVVPSVDGPRDAMATPQPPIAAAPANERSLAELREGLEAIVAEMRRLSSTGIERERQSALLRLRMYRFLCHLPQADLALVPQLNDEALAAANICRRLGKLSHEPENPGGLPDAEFQRARGAVSKCNLSCGYSNLTKAIDLWMNDSDARNLGRLGHRRWCLNPKLQRLGLGRDDDFCAMWAFDKSRALAYEYEFISFPPPGYVPVDMFGPEYAWSITLNPAKYLAPELENITVQVFPIRRDQADREHPLEIEHLTVDTHGFGVNNCVILRPKSLNVHPLQSYQLELRGLQTIDGKPTSVIFVVRFVEAIVPPTPD
jgi:hypothetical protein